ncbi:hypothetical protein COU74_03585 [Candidatus Peregrinibacteria bacterium CG10_big_fil_rev_8_21_14_0_10_36_19]|nr:MAG: hypothetical protein COU74_03585 [Candidatus Peregrinibacteria bacterium CG10_big_fil_rev_8_21_14_0_10_36_19]
MQQKTAKEILKKVVEDYDNIAQEFDTTRKYNWKEFEQYLPYIKENDQVLDIGCGNGRLYKFLSENKKIKYIGLEKSKKLLDAAKKNFNQAKFVHGDMLKLPFKEKSQDVITSIASLHHIPSEKLRKKALTEMHKTLKENGILILSVWNLFQPKYKKYIWQSRIKSLLSLGKYDPRDTFIPWNNKAKRYYYAFTKNELEKLLTQANFQILDHHISNNFVYICKKFSK